MHDGCGRVDYWVTGIWPTAASVRRSRYGYLAGLSCFGEGLLVMADQHNQPPSSSLNPTRRPSAATLISIFLPSDFFPLAS